MMRLTFMDPGALNARLTLEDQANTSDGQGGETINWVQVAGLWGAVKPVADRFGEKGGAESAILTHRVTVRARSDVRRGMRIVWQGRALLIRTVSDPDEAGRYLTCHCEEMSP